MSANSPAPKGTPYQFPAGVKVSEEPAHRVSDGQLLEPGVHSWDAQGTRGIGAGVGPKAVTRLMSGLHELD